MSEGTRDTIDLDDLATLTPVTAQGTSEFTAAQTLAPAYEDGYRRLEELDPELFRELGRRANTQAAKGRRNFRL